MQRLGGACLRAPGVLLTLCIAWLLMRGYLQIRRMPTTPLPPRQRQEQRATGGGCTRGALHPAPPD